MRKLTNHETPSQAQTFTVLNNRYLHLGLCPPCAAQAAYGHQHGFNQVHPPCEGCAPLVARFPLVKTNGWRTHTRETLAEQEKRERGWA